MDISLYFTKFPREPLSQKGTPSCFNLEMSLSNPQGPLYSSGQSWHYNPFSWVWNEEVSACLDVNGCPNLHASFGTWIEHLPLLGYENPLNRGPWGYIIETPTWLMKPLGIPLVILIVCNKSIIMSSWSQYNLWKASPISLCHKASSPSPSPSIHDLQKIKTKLPIHA